MHVLVAHASRHGSTTEVAARIAERLRELGHDATLRTARDRAPVGGRDDPDAWTAARDQLESALAKLAWLNPAAIAVFGGKDPKPKHGVVRDLRDWAAVDVWAESLVGGGPAAR